VCLRSERKNCRSGDAAVLRNKRYIEGLRLDCLPPESELVHSTWESELMNMAQLLAVDIPVALQQARVLVELRTAPNSALCEHGAPLISGQVLCSLFDASLNPTPAAYMELQNFLVANPFPQGWLAPLFCLWDTDLVRKGCAQCSTTQCQGTKCAHGLLGSSVDGIPCLNALGCCQQFESSATFSHSSWRKGVCSAKARQRTVPVRSMRHAEMDIPKKRPNSPNCHLCSIMPSIGCCLSFTKSS